MLFLGLGVGYRVYSQGITTNVEVWMAVHTPTARLLMSRGTKVTTPLCAFLTIISYPDLGMITGFSTMRDMSGIYGKRLTQASCSPA
jgi:hypothetical protein